MKARAQWVGSGHPASACTCWHQGEVTGAEADPQVCNTASSPALQGTESASGVPGSEGPRSLGWAPAGTLASFCLQARP